MPSIDRRAVLAAAVPLLAGCPVGSRQPESATSPTPTESASSSTPTTPSKTSSSVHLSPGEAYETADGWTVTVRDITVQRYISQDIPHFCQRWYQDAQFATAWVELSDDADLEPADLTIRTVTDVSDGPTERYDLSGGLAAPRRKYGFVVPLTPRPSSGGIAWVRDDKPDVHWRFSEVHIEQLRNPPEFELRKVEIDDRVDPGEPIEVTLTVANVGERDGTFLSALGLEMMSGLGSARIEVPAGETVESSHTIGTFEGEASYTIIVSWQDCDLGPKIRHNVNLQDTDHQHTPYEPNDRCFVGLGESLSRAVTPDRRETARRRVRSRA